ncbi:MAG: hypothetical protein WCX82_03485 [archaeon]|jgi:hypothetical protein
MKIEQLYFIKVTFKDALTLDTLIEKTIIEKTIRRKSNQNFISITNKKNKDSTCSELEFYYDRSPSLASPFAMALTQTEKPTHYNYLHETTDTINYISKIMESYLPSETYKIESVYNYIIKGKIQIISEYMFHSRDIKSWIMIPYNDNNTKRNIHTPLYICDNCHILTYYGSSKGNSYNQHICAVCDNTSNDQRIKDAQLAYKLLTT